MVPSVFSIFSSIHITSYTFTSVPNLPNPNPIFPNLIPNSPSAIPTSSYTYVEVQTMVHDVDVQRFFKVPSPYYPIHKDKRKETSPLIFLHNFTPHFDIT